MIEDVDIVASMFFGRVHSSRMFKKPVASASRRLTSPQPSSKLLAALDSLDLTGDAPVKAKRTKLQTVDPVDVEEEKKNLLQSLRLDNVDMLYDSFLGHKRLPLLTSQSHPLFQIPCTTSDTMIPQSEQPRRTNTEHAKKTRRVKRATTTVIPLEADEAPVQKDLPPYSYKDYEPKPCLVYTTHEEETNDLVDTLKPGSVLLLIFLSRLYIKFHHSSAVAMDLEWRVTYFRKQGTNASTQRERKVAVVQIADGAGIILVVQINEMRSE